MYSGITSGRVLNGELLYTIEHSTTCDSRINLNYIYIYIICTVNKQNTTNRQYTNVTQMQIYEYFVAIYIVFR